MIHRRGRSRGGHVIYYALLIAALAALVFPLSASAAAPELLASFGQNCGVIGKIVKGECAAAGETVIPVGVVTDPVTGHVFVVNWFSQRVDEFTPWGQFVKGFGWDVAPDAVDEEQEIRVRAAGGQFTLEFEGETTGNLPFNAEASAVAAALNGLPAVGNVTVDERKGNPNGTTPFIYVVRFMSPGGTNVPQIVPSQGTTPLSGGDPTTTLEVYTRTDGSAASTGLETCTTESDCKSGSEGAGSGQFAVPLGIAMDSSHNLYIVDSQNHRVQKFDPAGHFLLMFGGGVDQTTSGDVCTQASGHTCGPGSVGTGTGEFGNWNFGSFITVGSDGTVYVGDKERIQKFNSSGAFESSVALPGKGTVSSLAVAPSGNIWVGFNNQSQIGFPENPNIFELTSTGSPICTITAGRPTTLASDGAGNVYVYASPVYESPTELETQEIRLYNGSCAKLSTFASHDLSNSVGIGVNSLGDVYAANPTQVNSYVNLYGPPPVDFESALPVPPEIATELTAAVGTETARVAAQINPKFWPDTKYYVQYGLQSDDCEVVGLCSTQPLPPGNLLTEKAVSTSVATEAIELKGLIPGASYHYRFVAESGGGGPVLGEYRSFKTFPGGPSGLPDGRVYEKVSPAAKHGGEVAVPGPAGGGSQFMQPQQAAPSGSEVSYASATAFQDPESAPAASQYLSSHDGGGIWSTQNLDPLFEEGFLRDPVVGFSEDLSHAALSVIEPVLTSEAPVGYPNLYWRDNATGALATMVTQPPNLSIPQNEYCLFYAGSSLDSRRVFFGAKGGLIDSELGGNGFNLYEWSADRPAAEALRPMSVLPDDTAATPADQTSFGGLGVEGMGVACDSKENLMRGAISVDGALAFWTYDGSYEGANRPLFARVNGAKTLQLDAKEGSSGVGGEGVYWDASTDGTKVLFTDTKKLIPTATPAASKPDLYRYNFDHEAGERLEDLTTNPGEAADVQGVLGTSDDGSYVYFVAKGKLASNPNPEGDVAHAGGNNLYVWHENDGVRYLGTLASLGDSSGWARKPKEQTSRVSADGSTVSFLSQAELTGLDNTDVVTGKPDSQVFLYDYAADVLACASCNSTGALPHGAAELAGWTAPYAQPRYLSDDGDRLFFETPDALDPNDTNEKRDVYEYERSGTGSCTSAVKSFDPVTSSCLFLISTGKSTDSSYFVDSSTSGNDVFISTRQKLIFTDKDAEFDVYDARVGGEEPAPPPPICEGEGCRGAGTSPPPPSLPGTKVPLGPKQCPKGTHKVTKEGKGSCQRNKKHKKHKKKKHHKKHKKGRTTGKGRAGK